MKYLVHILLIVCICSSCSIFRRDRAQDAAVQIGNIVLTRTELDDITRQASTPEDSALWAEAYIRQWAGDILFAEKSTQRRDEQIEALVDAYRRELYLHTYEEKIVKKSMDKQVEADTIQAFYDRHSDMFVLDTHIMKGVLLIVPNGAPDMAKLKKWMLKPEDNIEKIEKYAYQYATGYELFTEEWKTASQLVMHLPLDIDQLGNALRKQNQLEVADSIQTYLLEVTDKHFAGEVMPVSFAQPEIKKIILHQRQVDFLQAERNKMVDEAEKLFKIKRYEN